MSNRAIRAGDRMAVAPRGRLELSQKRREASPERTMVWTEPKPRCSRVPVVYYLSRNGHLEHPHFMEVPISSDGLYLKDVINRLNLLRGKGMATMYSWSSKRSYKNGFVWHDLSEDDFIYPAHGNEYVLKGSELLQPPAAAAAAADVSSPDTSASSSSDNPKSAKDDIDFAAAVTRKKTPWKSLDLNEYKVYKNQLTAEASAKAADASTQTDERRRQRRREFLAMKEEGEGEEETHRELNPTTELAREEISPPPSSSSPETLETLIRADGRLIPIRPDEPDRGDAAAVSGYTSGRMKASAVLMHLISCGSISVKEHGDLPAAPPQTRRSRPRPRRLMDTPSFPSISLEEKEYFSGSLIEIKKKAGGAAGLPELKRSSSYNADRSSRLEVEIEGVRARCIPRKPKASPAAAAARKEGSSGCVARSAHGSKRVNGEIPETTEN